MEHAAVLSTEGVSLPEHFPPSIAHPGVALTRASAPPTWTLAQVEEAHIQTVLEMTEGNRTRAAKVLGISPTTLWRKLKDRPSGPAGSVSL